MSLRLDMLRAARLAPRLLGESSELVQGFLLRQQNTDGGFKNRSGQSDLYYSVFGIEGLLAITDHDSDLARSACQKLESYLRTFGSGESLDLVHLSCLIRCWADVGKSFETSTRLEIYRANDGAYNPVPGSKTSTPYGSFLVLSAYQDLQTEPPKPSRIIRCLAKMQNENGSWENATNATAAALAGLGTLASHIPFLLKAKAAKHANFAAQWLLARSHPQGGFLAVPNAPMPDLLSTATVLHTLAGLGVSLDAVREKCLDYLDSLWTNEGSFHGHWLDDTLDCEYTYYGLLALGRLAVS